MSCQQPRGRTARSKRAPGAQPRKDGTVNLTEEAHKAQGRRRKSDGQANHNQLTRGRLLASIHHRQFPRTFRFLLNPLTFSFGFFHHIVQ